MAPSVLSLLSIIYSDIIEPFFCLLYAYILVRVLTAKIVSFRSEFYVFSIATGVAAIANVLLAWSIRLVDIRFPFFPNRGPYLNVLFMFSHMFSLAISIGKTLSVTTRFTAICFMHRKNIWKARTIRIGLVVMFGVPTAIYCYFPAFPADFAKTENEYGMYIGIPNPGLMIGKAFATCGYLCFFLTTVPMCVLSVLKLRRETNNEPQGSDRQAKMLAFYAFVLTTSHMIKSALQTIWFVALLTNMKDLQATVVSQYLLPNSLSAFAEPLLLLITSPRLREEVRQVHD